MLDRVPADLLARVKLEQAKSRENFERALQAGQKTRQSSVQTFGAQFLAPVGPLLK